jgi:hypothetical protein
VELRAEMCLPKVPLRIMKNFSHRNKFWGGRVICKASREPKLQEPKLVSIQMVAIFRHGHFSCFAQILRGRSRKDAAVTPIFPPLITKIMRFSA